MIESVEARYLPPILRQFAEIIGLANTAILVKHYGGTRLYVPKQFDPEHPIAKLIGHECAVKLTAAVGGNEHIDIPKGEIAIKAVRDVKIRNERASGVTQARLAIKYQLTERQIRNICGPEDDDRQSFLF